MYALKSQLKSVLRGLVKSPVFAVVSVITLALAIGGNTAIFSVVNGVLLKPLPFDEPEQLVGVWHEAPGLGIDLMKGGLVAAIGIVFGLAAAAGLTRLMSSLLYGVSPSDPITYALVALVVSAIALFATYIPARRATTVDPIEALRWE